MNNIFNDVADTTSKWACKNAPTILTCIGAAGVIFTAVASGKAAIKAKEKLEELPEDADMKEKAKVVLPIMVKPTILACGTIWVIFRANKIALRRNAALLAAYTLSSRRLEEYEDKVVETIGEGKNKKIKDAIAEDHVEKDPPPQNIIIASDGTTIPCKDGWTGQWFSSTIESIRTAEANLNEMMKDEGFVCLNDYCQELGLEYLDYGDSWGWFYDAENPLTFEYSSILRDGIPTLVISFPTSRQPEEHYGGTC